MFEQSLSESAHAVGGRKPAAVLLSLGLQSGLIATAALVPLPHHAWLPLLETPPAVPLLAPFSIPPPPAMRRIASTVTSAAPFVLVQAFNSPRVAATAAPVVTLASGFDLGFAGPELSLVAPPPAVTPTSTPTPQAVADVPVIIGGEVEAARCLHCPSPEYPAAARRARIEGTVELRARIGADGAVADLARVRGNALLAAAAELAVRSWRYSPLLLNGRPVAVDTVVTINFRLDR